MGWSSLTRPSRLDRRGGCRYTPSARTEETRGLAGGNDHRGQTRSSAPRVGRAVTGVSLVWRNVVRCPRRAALTVAGAAIATATYLVLVGLTSGLEAEFQRAVAALGSDLVVQQAGAPTPLVSRLEEEDLAVLAGMPQMRAVSPMVVGMVRTGESSYLLVVGASPSLFPRAEAKLVEGRHPEPGTREMLLGRAAARRLEIAPGDRVELMRRQVLAVTGVFESGTGISDSAAVMEVERAQEVFGLAGQVNLALVRVHDRGAVDEVIAAVEARLPHLMATYPDRWPPQDRRQMEMLSRFARLVASIAFVLLVVGVATTMTMGILERLPEIGVLRAVGWARWRVAALILGEVVILAIAGFILAVPSAHAAMALLDQRLALWFGDPDPDLLPVVEGGILVVVAAVVGALPGLRVGARSRPADALRRVNLLN